MNAIDQLKAVLCDPESKCCVAGSDEDRLIVDRALEALAYLEQEPVGFVVMERQPLTDEQIDNATRKQVDALLDHIYEYGTAAEGSDFRVRAIARAIEAAHGIGEERMKTIGCVQHDCDECKQLREQNTALDAKLAEIEVRSEQEPWSPKDTAYRPGGLAQPEQIDWEGVAADQAMTIALLKSELQEFANKEADAVEVALTESGWIWDGDQWQRPAQPEPADNGITVDLLEKLKATLTKLGYATPEGGLEQFGARLPTQLYNLCRAVDGLLKAALAQPKWTVIRPVTNRCPKCVGLSCLCDGSCIKPEEKQSCDKQEPSHDYCLGWNAAKASMALMLAEMQDWEAVAADQAMTIALLKSEQEPVAWMHITDEGNIRMWSKSSPESIEAAIGVKPMPLYKSPPQRQPLTESKIKAIANIEGMNNRVTFARAIEAAHGIGDKT